MNQSDLGKKLSDLRSLMQTVGADYYYVPSSDQHKNEYVPTCWQRRAWISHFTGSAGDALIGKSKAYLWTDPRYFLQAEQELDPKYFQLMKQMQGAPPIDQWLLGQENHCVLAVDPKVISMAHANRLQHALAAKQGKLLPIHDNFIDKIWTNQPPLPQQPVYLYPEQYSGKSTQIKIRKLQDILIAESCDAMVINQLDAIAWIFNIRGNDIDFNPLTICYAIFTQKNATLFIDSNKLDSETSHYFKKHHVLIKPYDALAPTLNQFLGTIWIDPNTTSWWIIENLKKAQLFIKTSPILLMKSLKNPIEQKGMQDAHIYDATAVIQFLHWLQENWQQGTTEISAAEKLTSFRKQNKHFINPSFATISAFGKHGAIIHYSATEKTNCKIDDTSLYLVDSGGQYWQGTTDITRTIHLGRPTQEQMHLYTLVLKGHLALRHLKFPNGTCGEHINAIAHMALWDEGLDYGHGTGHGVGCHLCVHEGPQVIASRNTNVPLLPGMIVSNEPGCYLANKYGIRIENLVLITEKIKKTTSLTGHGPFFGFEDLTLVPYCRALIETKILTQQEIDWINRYHQHIYEMFEKRLSNTNTISWLKENTKPL